jgi:CheY-like chemotaxis protein
MENRENGLVVLVVDDDASIRELVSDALRDDGYRVVAAADGAEGLAALPGLGLCLVLLDIRMPNVDGWEFSRRYRAANEHSAPIVVMTAAENALVWCAEIGAEGCLPKPFDLDDLSAIVARFCGVPA